MSAIYQVDTDLHLVPVLGLRPLNEILIVHKGPLLLAWSQPTFVVGSVLLELLQ